jgi:hypothetical protein
MNDLPLVGRRALIVGAAGLAILLIAGFFDVDHALRAYLYAWLVCLGIALGSVALMMMHELTGGTWGLLVRPSAEAAARTLPLLAVLFIPIALGASHLFPWARASEVASSALLRHRQIAFAPGLVLLRSVIYFAMWIFLAWGMQSRLRRFSGLGLVIYFATISLAAMDWIASREVDWYSSTFGLAFVVGQAATAVSFLIVVLALLQSQPAVRAVTLPDIVHDLGNLLLTIVVLWAYIEFAQFLVIWCGNMQEDITWFYHRSHRGWNWVGTGLIVLHFAVPFVFLLFQGSKRNINRLAMVAGGVLFMRVVHVLWMIAPSNRGEVPHAIHWLDLIAPFGVGGIWFACFLWLLRRRPLVFEGIIDERGDEQPAIA